MLTVVKFFENKEHKYICSCGRVYTIKPSISEYKCCSDPSKAIAKFWPKNRWVSRTLRKVAVLQDVDIEKVTEDSWWLVEIVKEIGSKTPKGCFIVSLQEKILAQPNFLVPGLYHERIVGGNRSGEMVLIIDPIASDKQVFYTLPLDFKKELSITNNYNAIIVNHGGRPNWETA